MVTIPRIGKSGMRIMPDDVVYLKPGDPGYEEALARQIAFENDELDDLED